MSISGTIAAAFTLYFTGGNFAAAAAAYSIAAGVEAVVLAPTNRVRGPQLSDLTNQISAEGATLPILEGTMRFPGNIFKASDKVPTDHTTTTGKGGGDTVSTTTTYSATFAIAYCDVYWTQPALGARRFWFDKKLYIDIGAGAEASTVIVSTEIASSIRFYSGSEDQLPDPWIESVDGVGNASAYRGTCYIVFENFQLELFGNRIPQIDVEIIGHGSKGIEHQNVCALNPEDPGWYQKRGRSWITNDRIYWWRETSSSTNTDPDSSHLAVFLSTDGEEKQVVLPQVILPGSGEQYCEYREVNTRDRYLMNICQILTVPPSTTPSQSLLIYDVVSAATIEDDGTRRVTLRDVHDNGYDRLDACQYRMVAFDQDNEVVAISGRATSGRYYGCRILVSKAGYNLYTSQNSQPSAVGDQFRGIHQFKDDSDTSLTCCCALAAANDRVFAMIYNSSISKMQLLVLDAADASLLDAFDGPSVGPNFSGTDIQESIHTDGSTVWAWASGGGGTVWKWRVDGTLVMLATGIEGLLDSGTAPTDLIGGQQTFICDDYLIMLCGVAVNGLSGSPIFRHQLVRWNAVTAAQIVLGDIVKRHCARWGVAYDVSELTDLVPGALITKQMTSKEWLEYLASAYHFDGIPNGNSLYFKKRGGAAVARIDIDDLAAHDFGAEVPDAFAEDRTKEDDIPKFFSVNYTAKDNDYLPGSVPSQRLNTTSQQTVALDITALATDATFAIRLGEVARVTSLVERQKGKFAMHYGGKKFQPGDVVEIDAHDIIYRRRIEKITDHAGLLQFEHVADDAEAWNPVLTGAGQQSSSAVVITARTDLAILDIPPLRDEDTGAPLLYGKLVPALPLASSKPWTGASLFRTDVSPTVIGRVAQRSWMGNATTVLSDWSGINGFDEINSFVAYLHGGVPPASVTRDRALGGANALLVGDEILIARSITYVSAGTYRFSGLLRYLRGTEDAKGHVTGEIVVPLEMAGMLPIFGDPAAVDAYRKFVATTDGKTIDDSFARSITSTGRSQKPFAPVDVRVDRSTSPATLSWHRRSRKSGRFLPAGLQPMLGESTEAYSVDVFTGTTLVTSLSTTTPNVSDAALVPGRTATVYQLSEAVGRGIGASITL